MSIYVDDVDSVVDGGDGTLEPHTTAARVPRVPARSGERGMVSIYPLVI